MTINKGTFDDLIRLNDKLDGNTNSEVYAHRNTTGEDAHAHNMKILNNIQKIYIEDFRASQSKINQAS